MTHRKGIRLCTVYKWAGSKGFGFTLTTIYKDDAPIHYIESITNGSSAAYSGLHIGDRVVAVNGLIVSGLDHAAAVEKVAMDSEVTTLLVVDRETYGLYESHYRIIDADIPSVTRIQGPQADINEVLTYQAQKHGSAPTAPFHDIRLCLIPKWPGKKSFGYVMEYSDDWVEVRVTDVDPSSSAARAGLRIGDRVAEVDGIAVSKENSAVVTSKITSSTSDRISLLVASERTFWYFRSRQMLILSNSRIVVQITGPTVSLDYDTGYSENIAGVSETHVEDLTTCVLNAETIKVFSRPKTQTSKAVDKRHDQYIAKRCSGIRLCIIHKWPDFEGFGFTLLSRKTNNKRYVLEVHPQSPAAYSGLRKGDRVLEVNGVPVVTESHQQLIDRIKSSTDAISLLVVDEETDSYYKIHHQDLSSTRNLNMPVANRIVGPSMRPGGSRRSADGGFTSAAQVWHSTPKMPLQEMVTREMREPELIRTETADSLQREHLECTMSTVEPDNTREDVTSPSLGSHSPLSFSSESSLEELRPPQLKPVEINSPDFKRHTERDVTAVEIRSQDTPAELEIQRDDSALHSGRPYSHQITSSTSSSAVAADGIRPCERLLAADRARIAQLKLKFIAGIIDDREAELAPSSSAQDHGASSSVPSSTDGTGTVRLPISAEGSPKKLGGAISRLRRDLLRHFGYNSSEISAKLAHCQLFGNNVNYG